MQFQKNPSGSPALLELIKPENFYDLVLGKSPKTAVFDCDGTLWHGDTGSDFMRWTIETGMISRETGAWLDRRYRLYHKGEISESTICGEMVQIYAGLKDDELRRTAKVFFQQRFEQNFFPEMFALAQQLTAAGATLWVVSSTNSWVVEEGAARIGVPVERVLASRARIVHGTVTSDLLDVPTGEGKAEALRRAGVFRPDVVFGNSVHDEAMLCMAAHAVAIHPSAALRRKAEGDGWTVYLPAKLVPPL